MDIIEVNEQIKKLQYSIMYLEHIVFENETSFVETFCARPEEVMEFLAVYFSSSVVKFYYVMNGGQHIGDDISMEQFEEWLNYITND